MASRADVKLDDQVNLMFKRDLMKREIVPRLIESFLLVKMVGLITYGDGLSPKNHSKTNRGLRKY